MIGIYGLEIGISSTVNYLMGVQEMDILDLGNFLFIDGDSDILSYCPRGIFYLYKDSEGRLIEKLTPFPDPYPLSPQCDECF